MRATSRIVCVSLCLVLFTAAAHATTHVLSVEPRPQRVDVPANAAIQVTFDQPIDDTLSVNAISFRVFGRWSGPASGNRTVNGNIMTFTPNQPFFAGEWVTVNVSRNITSTSGETSRRVRMEFLDQEQARQSQPAVCGRITTRLASESTAPYGGYAGDLERRRRQRPHRSLRAHRRRAHFHE
jgi:methionine-rich copper-binding protein CopC